MNTLLKLIALITIITVNLACSQKANTAEDTVALQRADSIIQNLVNTQLFTQKKGQELSDELKKEFERENELQGKLKRGELKMDCEFGCPEPAPPFFPFVTWD